MRPHRIILSVAALAAAVPLTLAAGHAGATPSTTVPPTTTPATTAAAPATTVAGPATTATAAATTAAGAPAAGGLVPVDVGVQPIDPTLAAIINNVSGFTDTTTALVDYGFSAVPMFPVITNGTLVAVSGRYTSPTAEETGTSSLQATYAVGAPATDLQRVADATVAALGLSANPDYELSSSSGTNDGTAYVQIDLRLTNYDVAGPDWTVYVYQYSDPVFPDTAILEIDRDEYSLEGEGYEMAPKILADNADIVAVATDLGLALRGTDMIVGVNSIGGSNINNTGLSYQVTGEPQDVAVTVCTALGFTAEPDDSDVDRASCDGGGDRSIYVSISRNYSVETLTDVSFSVSVY